MDNPWISAWCWVSFVKTYIQYKLKGLSEREVFFISINRHNQGESAIFTN